jgi:hypothetical protein
MLYHQQNEADMITKLKEELADAAYTGMTDQQAADALNAEIEVAQEYMLTDIRLAAAIGTVKAVTVIEAFKTQGDAVSLWIVEKLASTGLDIGNAEAPAFVQPLVTAGVVTQAEADQILALGKTTTTRERQIGFNIEVLPIHVTEARS